MIKKYAGIMFNIIGSLLLALLFLIIVITDFAAATGGIGRIEEGRAYGIFSNSYYGEKDYSSFQLRIFENNKIKNIKESDYTNLVTAATAIGLTLLYVTWLSADTSSKEIRKNIIFYNRNP